MALLGSYPNAYQVEHDLLFAAIRQNQPYNEVERSAKANLVALMGRFAVESGKLLTWDETLASKREEAPGLENLTMESPAPVMPDAQGHYPIPMPGITPFI